jgi:glycosyltransferase involved in cell wall biosynthesis
MYSTVRFKACEVALEAYRLARQRVPQLKLVAFGSMRPTPALPLPDGAEFHHRPAQDSLRELYAACDAWLFASRSEGFGLPPLEAMACGTPVIATPAGAAPELVEQGGGVLVPFDDPRSMADAIERIAKMDDASWRDLSGAARAAVNGWTWDDAVDRFESIVTQMTATPAGASAC